MSLSENITDLYESVKERLTSPLIFSFIVSWLIVNWQITVALLWYDPIQINASGYKSIFDFILAKSSWAYWFWWPLGVALFYSFGMQVISGSIKLYRAWVSVKIDHFYYKITKVAVVPKTEFDKMKSTLLLEIDAHRDRVDTMRKMGDKNDELRIENSKLTTQIEGLTKSHQSLSTRSQLIENTEFIQGYWKVNYEGVSNKNLKGLVWILINDHQIFHIGRTGEKTLVQRISQYKYDTGRESVFFVKTKTHEYDQNLPLSEFKITNEYLQVESEDLLVGNEHELLKVRYTKSKKPSAIQLRQTSLNT